MGQSQRYQAAVDGHKPPKPLEHCSEKGLAQGVRSRNTFPGLGGPWLLGDAQRSIRKYYAPALGAFSIAPERRKNEAEKENPL